MGLPGVATLDDAAALSARLAKAGPRDVVAGMFFHSTREELTRKLGPLAAARASQLALGDENKDFEHFYRYPVANLLSLMDLGARMAGGDYSATLADFGRAAMQSFLDSSAGRTLLVLGGQEPHRTLVTLLSGHHAPASFGPRTYERTGSHSAVLHYGAELLGASWTVGTIVHAFHSIFGLSPKATVPASVTSGTFDLTLHW